MSEFCRLSCRFCNASKDAYEDEHMHEDTAAHACPDGSDLGGGLVLIASKDPKRVAADEFGNDILPDRGQSAMALHDHYVKVDARPSGSHAESKDQPHGPSSMKRPLHRSSAHRHHVPMSDQSEHVALDVAWMWWPFLLIQSVLLVAVGFVLRGCVEKRRRPRIKPLGLSGHSGIATNRL